MPDTFILLSEVEWVEQLVCDRYKVKIPKFLADYHQWWGDWEKARFRSMEENLKRGDILFDVGAEIGWQSAIYAQFVGGENMCLFEPCPELWPNIKATWEANKLELPMMTACGFVGDTDHLSLICNGRSWPEEANDNELLTNTKFQHIDENPDTSSISLDEFIRWTQPAFIPRAITIDVEGWELAVLQGAVETLKKYRPLVWVSLHEGWIERPGVNPKDQDVLNFMRELGYDAEFLGADHERHFMFRPFMILT